MITKSIETTDGYNRAIIEKMFQSGDVEVTLQQAEAGEDGNETIVKEDHHIGFPAGYFEFTPEELAELKFVNIQQLVEEII